MINIRAYQNHYFNRSYFPLLKKMGEKASLMVNVVKLFQVTGEKSQGLWPRVLVGYHFKS